MYGPQPYKKVTFFQVAFKGMPKFVFIIGLVLILLGPIVFGILDSMKPATKFYNTQDGTVGLDISDLTMQPVTISCSHTWRVTPSMMGIYTADSDEIVAYSIKILDKNGNSVYNEGNTIELPTEITFYGYGTVSHSESSDNHADLAPGHYEMTITSTQTLSCTVVQKYRYQDAMVAMILIGLIGVIVVAFWVWLGLYTVKHTSLFFTKGSPPTPQQSQPPVSQPSYYSNLYSSQGLQPSTSPPTYQVPAPNYQAPAASSYSYPPSYGTSSQELISSGPPQDYNPSQSNLEYRQGGYTTELVCSNCHRPVRSQPVQGIVTCEFCGEKARVY